MGGSYGTTVSVTDGAPVRPLRSIYSATSEWFAVQTRYRFEKKVAEQLTRKNLEVFLPLRIEHHSWSDRQMAVTVPLFPGYAFVRINRSRDLWHSVLHTAGLIGFVTFGGAILPVPPKQIEHLQLLLQEKVPCSLHPFVHAGQRVRVRGGCLHGLEGVLKRENGKLVISIESIQRSIAIELKGYELDLI